MVHTENQTKRRTQELPTAAAHPFIQIIHTPAAIQQATTNKHTPQNELHAAEVKSQTINNGDRNGRKCGVERRWD